MIKALALVAAAALTGAYGYFLGITASKATATGAEHQRHQLMKACVTGRTFTIDNRAYECDWTAGTRP